MANLLRLSSVVSSAVLVVAGACFPRPLDELGKRCSSSRQCRSELFCVDGYCVDAPDELSVDGGGGAPDAGDGGSSSSSSATDGGSPPNLLFNPDFEDGSPPTGWNASGTLTVTSSNVRRGVQAAALSGGNLWLEPSSPPVSSPVAGTHYCVSLWVRGDGSNVRVLVRENGGGPDTGLTVATSSAWVPVRVARTATGGSSLSIRLQGPLFGPAQFDVDDAFLWRGSSPACTEH